MTRIVVDPARQLGTVDRNVFGGFVEHLGRCIYGGLYDEGSPLADERGFRTDVLGLLRELRMGVLRWPGGNFVSNYHWADGIGPKDSRPRRPELAWGGEESNRFGTDEFLAYCAELGTEPYICLNMGTGTLEEALAWVEYCNGARRHGLGRSGAAATATTSRTGSGTGAWATRCTATGRSARCRAEEYVRTATRWARAIKMLDPQARLVSCGMNGWNDWDRVVIDGMAPLVDYHSLHIYTGSDDYWTNVLQPHQAERAIRCARALIERAAYVKKIAAPPRIAYDEWNVWYREPRRRAGGAVQLPRRAGRRHLPEHLHPELRLGPDGQPGAAGERHRADRDQPGRRRRPAHLLPGAAARQAALDVAVDVHVSGPIGQPGAARRAPSRWPHRVADLGPFALVDAAATVAPTAARVAVTLVNRSPDEPETAEIVLRDLAFDRDPRGQRRVTAERGRRPAPAARCRGCVPGRGVGHPEGRDARPHPAARSPSPSSRPHGRRLDRPPGARPAAVRPAHPGQTTTLNPRSPAQMPPTSRSSRPSPPLGGFPDEYRQDTKQTTRLAGRSPPSPLSASPAAGSSGAAGCGRDERDQRQRRKSRASTASDRWRPASLQLLEQQRREGHLLGVGARHSAGPSTRSTTRTRASASPRRTSARATPSTSRSPTRSRRAQAHPTWPRSSSTSFPRSSSPRASTTWCRTARTATRATSCRGPGRRSARAPPSTRSPATPARWRSTTTARCSPSTTSPRRPPGRSSPPPRPPCTRLTRPPT